MQFSSYFWFVLLFLCHAFSVQFSRSVVSDSLWSRGLQNARPPCPSPLPELAQTHVHWVGDAVQPSHPLLSPSPAFNLSQLQGLFRWGSSSHQVAKVLSFSFSISPSNEYLGLECLTVFWWPKVFSALEMLLACLLYIQWDYWNFLPRVGENNLTCLNKVLLFSC